MDNGTHGSWRQLRRWLPFALVGLVGFALGLCLDSAPPATEDAHADHDAAPAEDVIWTCAMHPQIRQGEPGQCPICGMDLIPVEQNHGADDNNPAQIVFTERARIRAQLRTAPVQRLASGRIERHLLGRIDYAETTLRTVTAWVGGRIDKLHVSTTGEDVRQGQVIATLYSPEVYSAHQDLLEAKQQLRQFAKTATATARGAAKAALDASRSRLRLLGVPEKEVLQMERASAPSEHVKIRTPFSGTVIERLATQGNYVKTGSGLYRVADLSLLWVQLDAYESDLPLLSVGQDVSLTVEALPGETFEGKVTFVDPVINQRTRTTRVRIEVRNPEGRLRPGMFAEAVVGSTVNLSGERPLVVADSAPLFTGRRSVVYVEKPSASVPTYESRIVRLGPKMGSHYPVVAGLSEGERVVVHGAFALDADLQIRGGLSMMGGPDDTESGPYDDIVAVPERFEGPLAKIVDAYLRVHADLASDDFERTKRSALELEINAKSLKPKKESTFRNAWLPLRRLLMRQADAVAAAPDIAASRAQFRTLSQHMATLLRTFGNPSDETLRLAFCPMALDGEGAEWIQRSTDIENPYFGAAMHACGEIHEVVGGGTYLPAKMAPAKRRQQPSGGGHQH